MASAVQTILGIEKAMVRDFNAGKMARLLANFHPRVIGFSSTRQEKVAGRAAMRKTFDYYHKASSRTKYHIAKPEVHVFGEVAVATFYWTVELGSGRPRHAIRGRGSHVFARHDGKWLIVHEHFSRAH
ncbi:MAG TPA: nuclear transport factor 2 family protein [Terriglobia bacterium]|nr:nuclear transport factor 2 family protein [Terriglobia bacterium]